MEPKKEIWQIHVPYEQGKHVFFVTTFTSSCRDTYPPFWVNAEKKEWKMLLRSLPLQCTNSVNVARLLH